MSSVFQIVKFVIHKITISVYINDICVLKLVLKSPCVTLEKAK